MLQTQNKKGRPQAFHRTSWGDRIDGLAKLADGRWKVSTPNGKAIKFTESDERLAVARFHQITASRNPNPNIGTVKVHATFEGAFHDAWQRAHVTGRAEIGSAAVNEGMSPVTDDTLTPAQWAWLREQFFIQPKWLAQRLGIEQLGYLPELKRPTASLTFQQIIDTYVVKSVSADQIGRCKRFWKEFADCVGVKTIRHLSHEHVEAYEKLIRDMDLTAKSMHNRYSTVKTVLAYSLKRGKEVADCRKALDLLAMLEVDGIHSLDPRPISKGNFTAIRKAAIEADDKMFAALMLFALNAALYPSEVGAVRWDEVDLKRGEFSTRRHKTGVPRVAALWPATVKAIKALPQDRATIFNTCRQAYNRFSIHRDWNKHREAAEVPVGITFAQIRDASFTEACRVDLDKARVLAGHRLPGATDHYVLRDPQFVATACEAIRVKYGSF